jgi:Raf kinase inhibitor-like YbhB/YbcL family protein
MISRMSHSVAPTIASASLRSTVEAPRRAWRRAICLACCQIALLALGCGGRDAAPTPPSAPAKITLVSPAVTPDGQLPRSYTCDGVGTAPPLRWGRVPAGTTELVLVVSDPDAPDGRFVHWTVFGMPGSARSVPDDAKQGRNDFGKNGWGPPCPPTGSEHRYEFDLYALKDESGLDEGASPEDVIDAVDGALARGHLVARYDRIA